MSEETNLAPCPFCGNADLDETHILEDEGLTAVLCWECDCRGPYAQGDWSDENCPFSREEMIQDAIRQWNRRSKNE